jgi:hypothetical protein
MNAIQLDAVHKALLKKWRESMPSETVRGPHAENFICLTLHHIVQYTWGARHQVGKLKHPSSQLRNISSVKNCRISSVNFRNRLVFCSACCQGHDQMDPQRVLWA